VPALTTDQLHLTHSKYLDAADAADEGKFREALNEIMPRIYKMGYWREMLVEHTQDASDGYVSLPSDTDSIVAGILDDSPLPTRSLWHDYKLFGTNDDDKTNMSAFIDDGYASTYRDLDSDSQYLIKLASLKSPFTKTPTEGRVTIRYRQHSDASQGSNSLVGGETVLESNSYEEITYYFTATTGAAAGHHVITGDYDVSDVISITWNNTTADHPFRIIAKYQGTAGGAQVNDSTKDLLLANINTTRGSSRYRRFRIGGTDSTSSAHMLLKRKWLDVDSGSDLVHIPSNAIIKHALLGKLSEDNADLQRAQYHWGLVAQLLETDTDSYRGAAKPTLHIAPDGVGAGMSGMY
jgi:hypothetical protein